MNVLIFKENLNDSLNVFMIRLNNNPSNIEISIHIITFTIIKAGYLITGSYPVPKPEVKVI